MDNSKPTDPKSNTEENKDTEGNNGIEKIMESSTNTSFLMPVALLLVLLIIPFSINSFMHMMANKGKFIYPVIMKFPIDHEAIVAPTDAKQYEGFDVTLRVNTQTLAEFINDLVEISSAGTSIQGITGFISSRMKAEITGDHFRIENSGPQNQAFGLQDIAEWTWRVVPESSGVQTIHFKMHVDSIEHDHQKTNIIELAQANIKVDSNPMMWIVYHWWIFALLGLGLFGGWKALRRYNVE